MTTSKSPRRVLQVAYDAACQALPAHRHPFSPKKFTQPQLLSGLVLKEFLRLDYRGSVAHLVDHPDLRRTRKRGQPGKGDITNKSADSCNSTDRIYLLCPLFRFGSPCIQTGNSVSSKWI